VILIRQVLLLINALQQDIAFFIRENIISKKSKKQNVVFQSTVEINYKTMTSLTYEITWIK